MSIFTLGVGEGDGIMPLGCSSGAGPGMTSGLLTRQLRKNSSWGMSALGNNGEKSSRIGAEDGGFIRLNSTSCGWSCSCTYSLHFTVRSCRHTVAASSTIVGILSGNPRGYEFSQSFLIYNEKPNHVPPWANLNSLKHIWKFVLGVEHTQDLRIESPPPQTYG